MSDRLAAYSEHQRRFWDVPDLTVARFSRVLTLPQPSEEEWRAHTNRHLDILLDGMTIGAGWTLLDIGCGVGRLLREMKDFVPQGTAIGIDIAPNLLHFARQYVADERVALLQNNGMDLRCVKSSSVDYGYAVDVFIHVFDIDVLKSYIREANRVLKYGGFLRFNVTFCDPHIKLETSAVAMHRWQLGEPAGFAGNLYLPHEIEHIVSECGAWRERSFEIKLGASIWCTLRK